MVTLSGSAIWWTWETQDVFKQVQAGSKYAMKVRGAAAEHRLHRGLAAKSFQHLACMHLRQLGLTEQFTAGSEQQLTRQLTDLTTMVRRQISSEVRKKVNTLIITDVHARDILRHLCETPIMDASEFAWESQLRLYWDADADDLLIRQCTGGSWFCSAEKIKQECHALLQRASSVCFGCCSSPHRRPMPSFS